MAFDEAAERLHELLEAPDSPAVDDEELRDLVEVAVVLRHLPEETFRIMLRVDIERTATVTAAPDTTTHGVEANVARVSGISYLHIPAIDARGSAAFYEAVFDWEIRGDPDRPSFNDGTGHVTGHWVTDHPQVGEEGVRPYVFVNDLDDALEKVVANGGDVLRGPYPEGQLWVATFRDPAGNTIGVWQAGPRR